MIEHIRRRWTHWRGPVRLGLSITGIAVLLLVFVGRNPGFDFYAYWMVDPSDPYRIVDGFGAFHYAPPMAYLAFPLKGLPFEVAYAGWTLLNAGILVWLTRTWALAWCAFPPVASELFHGNIHLLIAAAIVLGLQAGPPWALQALTKVTTLVGLLWALMRGDRAVMVSAIVTTVAVSLTSLVVQGPDVWVEWFQHLARRSSEPEDGGALLDISILVRGPVSMAIAFYGARSQRPWTIPVAVTLAMPLLWFHSLAALVSIPRTSSATVSRGRM